ncbi:MAG: hypothetical protein CAK90_03360 [Spartobacteria bacterium AMD-G4]|nr:MAG: hypothetical protein CAK90_03360 [Spartobacteria bacterium AMD-G4]
MGKAFPGQICLQAETLLFFSNQLWWSKVYERYLQMVSPSFSWPTAAPHKTSKVFPKALPPLQACVSVFLDEKAVFQSIPSIWQTPLCSLAGWFGLRIWTALPSASGSWVGDEAWFLPNYKGDEIGAEHAISKAWPKAWQIGAGISPLG